MLDLKLMQKSPELVREALARRRSKLDIDAFLALDSRRRALLTEVETLKSGRNKASAEVAACKREGRDAGPLLAELGGIGERIKALDSEAAGLSQAVLDWQLTVPNTPHASVPDGDNETDNPVVATWGTVPTFDFQPLDHVELGVRLGGLDFEHAARLSGARFVVYRDWAARLERALIAFMLDVHCREHGYREIMTPVIVNRDVLVGTGQLPKFAEDLFKIDGAEQYLIPTAEVPVTNLHRDEVLDEDALSVTYACHTLCFRSEAGSYGKDTRGIIRQHQFNKVELVRFAHPERSYDDLELLRTHAETILRKLGLAYRVVALCTGDLGFASAKTYDLEVWLPGQNAYREISSCSNCEDFQARRANIRFKPKAGGKSQYVHTLNGSGLAVGRTMVAVLENYQQPDGSVIVPEALRPYLGGLERITGA